MRVAIVNDQRLAVETLRRVLSEGRHEVAWVAHDGEEALRRCRADRPDAILMDLVMPHVNGVEATRRIMAESPLAILVVTAGVSGNFQLVCDALSAGAYDAVSTPVLAGRSPAEAGAELLNKLSAVERVNRRFVPARGDGATLLVIGASTGGPLALATILADLPASLPAAVLIVQHIGAEHASCLAEWLQARSRLPVRTALPGDRPESGVVLLSGSSHHLVMKAEGILAYTSEPADYAYRPSIDVLFHSLAQHGSAPGIAVLLTGIGRDGAAGLLALRQAGWHTVAQDEATSVVYGMPRAAVELGAAGEVLPLNAIASYVREQVRRGGAKQP